MTRALIAAALLAIAAHAQTVLVVTAHAEDYLLCAGGTLAGMAQQGAAIHVVRVTNDEKTGSTSPEAAALHSREESERAAHVLGAKGTLHLGYRAGELGAVSPTELRDRINFLIRQYRPDVLFIPNPYAHNDPELDHHYAGSAAEEARWAAGLANFQPPHEQAGLKPHHVNELYYYSLPFDPQTSVAEAGSEFVPQPKTVDIAGSLDRKLAALRALTTYNRAVAHDVASRLARTGKKLAVLDGDAGEAANRLLEIRVRQLGAAETFLVSR